MTLRRSDRGPVRHFAINLASFKMLQRSIWDGFELAPFALSHRSPTDCSQAHHGPHRNVVRCFAIVTRLFMALFSLSRFSFLSLSYRSHHGHVSHIHASVAQARESHIGRSDRCRIAHGLFFSFFFALRRCRGWCGSACAHPTLREQDGHDAHTFRKRETCFRRNYDHFRHFKIAENFRFAVFFVKQTLASFGILAGRKPVKKRRRKRIAPF